MCCRYANPISSLHHQHASEPRVPAHHMLIRLIRLCERKRLNHALDAMKFREINRLLGIQGLTGRPTVDRGALEDQSPNVDVDIAARYYGQC